MNLSSEMYNLHSERTVAESIMERGEEGGRPAPRSFTLYLPNEMIPAEGEDLSVFAAPPVAVGVVGGKAKKGRKGVGFALVLGDERGTPGVETPPVQDESSPGTSIPGLGISSTLPLPATSTLSHLYPPSSSSTSQPSAVVPSATHTLTRHLQLQQITTTTSLPLITKHLDVALRRAKVRALAVSNDAGLGMGSTTNTSTAKGKAPVASSALLGGKLPSALRAKGAGTSSMPNSPRLLPQMLNSPRLLPVSTPNSPRGGVEGLPTASGSAGTTPTPTGSGSATPAASGSRSTTPTASVSTSASASASTTPTNSPRAALTPLVTSSPIGSGTPVYASRVPRVGSGLAASLVAGGVKTTATATPAPDPIQKKKKARFTIGEEEAASEVSSELGLLGALPTAPAPFAGTSSRDLKDTPASSLTDVPSGSGLPLAPPLTGVPGAIPPPSQYNDYMLPDFLKAPSRPASWTDLQGAGVLGDSLGGAKGKGKGKSKMGSGVSTPLGGVGLGAARESVGMGGKAGAAWWLDISSPTWHDLKTIGKVRLSSCWSGSWMCADETWMIVAAPAPAYAGGYPAEGAPGEA